MCFSHCNHLFCKENKYFEVFPSNPENRIQCRLGNYDTNLKCYVYGNSTVLIQNSCFLQLDRKHGTLEEYLINFVLDTYFLGNYYYVSFCMTICKNLCMNQTKKTVMQTFRFCSMEFMRVKMSVDMSLKFHISWQ